MQDFGGDPSLQGEIMLADKTTTAYWVGGAYQDALFEVLIMQQPAVMAIPPLLSWGIKIRSSEVVTTSGRISQKGYIIWNATNKTLTQDVCS